jgi:hypothetical protein
MMRVKLTEASVKALTTIRNEQDASGGGWVTVFRYLTLKNGSPPISDGAVQSATGYLNRLVGIGYLEFKITDSGKVFKITKKGRTALLGEDNNEDSKQS